MLQRTQKWPDGIRSVLDSAIVQNTGDGEAGNCREHPGRGPHCSAGRDGSVRTLSNTDGLIPKFKFCQITPL